MSSLSIKNKILIFAGVLLTVLLFASFAHAGTCSMSNTGDGTVSINSSCAFSGDVNGAENGKVSIDNSATLTVGNLNYPDQTIVWNSGQEITITNGTIAIRANSASKLQEAYLWMVDVDRDGYPGRSAQKYSLQTTSNTIVLSAGDPSTGSYVRRSGMTNISIVDCDDSDPTRNTDCSICTPISQAQACSGKECGTAGDTCGGTYDCGSCGAGEACSGNSCIEVCPPAGNCASVGATCGSVTVPNGSCGSKTLNCGSCSAGYTCSSNKCVVSCPAYQTKAEVCSGITCGTVKASNGDCTTRDVVCGTAMTKTEACEAAGGWQCGQAPDGCGGTVNCGPCPPNTDCSNKQCVPCKTCADYGAQCGSKTNNCGQTLNCGSCSGSKICSSNKCVSPAQKYTIYCNYSWSGRYPICGPAKSPDLKYKYCSGSDQTMLAYCATSCSGGRCYNPVTGKNTGTKSCAGQPANNCPPI